MEWTGSDGRTLRLITGDITRVPADAIVNAANSALMGGGGVDGAIHRAGGPSIMRELDGIRKQLGSCPPGSAVVTAAGNLPARYVFHAVGPIYRGGKQGEAELLASCYRTCMELAESHSVETISFPSISTGAYSYPLHEAAPIAIREVVKALQKEDGKVRQAVFVLFDERTCSAYAEALRTYE